MMLDIIVEWWPVTLAGLLLGGWLLLAACLTVALYMASR